MANVGISHAINAKRQHLQATSDISRADVLKGLSEIAVNPDHPASARVSAWRTLADILGLVVRRVDIEDHRGGLRDELAAMTLAEVLTIRDELAKALPAPGTIDSTARELHDGSAPEATNSVEHPRNMRGRTL